MAHETLNPFDPLGIMTPQPYEHPYMFYIASGWFNQQQAKDLEDIKCILDGFEIKYFSPKDEVICPPNANYKQRNSVFLGNIHAIDDSKYVIVNTRDKDMGTIFEAGYAYAKNKKIIYVAFGLQGQFNLMLAQSGVCVCTTHEQLMYAVQKCHDGQDPKTQYEGEIE